MRERIVIHSKIGASSMYRWSVCPGSVHLSEGIAPTQSIYAEEGTEAHESAAKALKGQPAPIPDDEMAAACDAYYGYVKSQVGHEDTLLVEHQFDLSSIHPGCFGTADAVIWKPLSKKLIVVDFKYGAGILVEAADNPQLMYYALGALLTCGWQVETVEMVIVQPRCGSTSTTRSHTIDAIDLLDFAADLKEYAVATEAPNAPLVPGDHCRFCPAAPTCPELAKRAQAVAKVEFRAGLSYDPQKLKLALDSREIVKAWLKAVDEFAYAEAEAGRSAPGYKLVAKRAMRKWRSEGEVIEKFQSLGDVIYEPRALKTPAQMEKSIAKNDLASFIVSESSGHTLVPESDKRPAVKSSAKEDFLNVN